MKLLTSDGHRAVPPAELEAVLPLHPGVADAGVVGVYSDEEGTELPLAYIVPKDADLLKGGDQEAFKRSVQDFLKDRVASYKLLRGGVCPPVLNPTS